MSENENLNGNEFTAEDGEIRFDPEKDREKHTEAEVEKVKKPKKAKWYFIIPLVFLALFAFVFIGWRIKPKTLLNVTDPSQRIVINNEGALSGQAKTVSTNGAIVSVLIADKQTGDQLYLFPEKKEDPSYKIFKWATWEKVGYAMREKNSFTQVKNYFSSK